MSKTADIDEAIRRVAAVVRAIAPHPKTTAIKVGKGGTINMTDVGIAGFDTAIDAEELEELNMVRVEMTAPEGAEIREAAYAKLQELETLLQNIRIGDGDARNGKPIIEWLKNNAPQILDFIWPVLSKAVGL